MKIEKEIKKTLKEITDFHLSKEKSPLEMIYQDGWQHALQYVLSKEKCYLVESRKKQMKHKKEKEIRIKEAETIFFLTLKKYLSKKETDKYFEQKIK